MDIRNDIYKLAFVLHIGKILKEQTIHKETPSLNKKLFDRAEAKPNAYQKSWLSCLSNKVC